MKLSIIISGAWLTHTLLIAPDALAQVKRGLRGLFSRKKKNQVQPNPAPNESSSSAVTSTPEATTSSVPPATKAGMCLIDFVYHCLVSLTRNRFFPPTDSNPPAPQPATTSSPQKVEPSALESSDRTPAPPTPSEPQVQPPTDSEATKNTDPSVTVPTSTDKPTSTSAAGNNGMSATSGPLDDQMVHEYSDIGKEDVGAPVSKEEAAIAGKAEITAAKPVNVDAVQT